MKANVNKIIRSSIVDGPGNRAAVFLQGCNYTCTYCHNPETIHVCSNCGICVSNCPVGALSMKDGKVNWQQEICCECDACIHNCPHLASPRVQEMSAAQVMEYLKNDWMFIRGITVSGGECSLQRNFLLELFRLVKEKGKTALMDSNGSYAYMDDEELMQVCDGVMLDVKAYNDAAHQKLTGRSSRPVLDQAARLAKAGKLEEIRTVIVPEVLPNEETVDNITKLLAPYLKIRSIRYKLIAYRPIGVREPYNKRYRQPTAKEMKKYEAIARKNGFENIVII